MTAISERLSARVGHYLAASLWLMVAASCAQHADDPTRGSDAGTPPGDKADDPEDSPDGAQPSQEEPLLALDASHWTRTLTDPEVDCFWDLGYRHIVLGTQIPSVTREQLAVALRGGFTVDLYIYLYWSESMEAQVQEALEIAQDYPEVGRIWLDIEEDPAGRGSSALILLIQRAIAAAGDFPIGIYTGDWFWFEYMNDTEVFSDIPLWYAYYDNIPSLDTYQPGGDHAFGGWLEATGKQWDDHRPATCGRAVDKNVMIRNTLPELVVDRSAPPEPTGPPAQLTGLRPSDGFVVVTDYARPTVRPDRAATSYDIEIEFWNGQQFRYYWSTSPTVSAITLFPVLRNCTYRWRIRAINSFGPGPWSEWAWFEYGAVTNGPDPAQINN